MNFINNRLARSIFIISLSLASVLAINLPRLALATGSSPPLGLDGFGLQNCGNTQSQSVSFNTANPNDILIVWISLAPGTGASVSDNNGLAWTFRHEVDTTGPVAGLEYFAKWTGSGLEDITVHTSCYSIIAFGIAGANFTSPFDPNPSLPSTATGTSGNCSLCYNSPSTTVSTSNSNDLLLGLLINNLAPAYNPEPGFACIAGTCDGVGTAYVVAEYQNVNSQVTNYPVSITTDGGWTGLVADAVEGLANSPSFSISFDCSVNCPNSLSVQAGFSITSNVTVTSINQFSGSLSLSATATPIYYPYYSARTPSGISVDLGPASVDVTAGGVATTSLTVTASQNTPPGIYTVAVTGTSGSQIGSSTPLRVTPPPGFSILPNIPLRPYWFPTSGDLVAQKGIETNVTLTVTSNYGFSGQVNLSDSVNPDNPPTATSAPVASLRDSAVYLTAGGNATTIVTISTNPDTSIGHYTVMIGGSNGPTTNRTQIFLTVRAPELDGVGSPLFSDKYHPYCNCATQTLSTAQGGDVVIVLVEQTNPVSINDTYGLRFNQRMSSQLITEYYAFSPKPLQLDNITVFAKSACCWNVQAFAVAGVNTTTIFETDPSVPRIVSCSGVGLESCSASISTTARDFVFTATPINDAGPCNVSPGFGEISEGGGSGDSDYMVAEQPQGNLTFTCSKTDVESILIDALSLNPTPPYTITWQGYDWDGNGEENVTLNGQLLALLPAVATPQNGGAWANFSLHSSAIVQGTDTLTFTHANWDCGVSDNVQNLQIATGSAVVYSNPASLPLDCTQSLSYTFTV